MLKEASGSGEGQGVMGLEWTPSLARREEKKSQKVDLESQEVLEVFTFFAFPQACAVEFQLSAMLRGVLGGEKSDQITLRNAGLNSIKCFSLLKDLSEPL